MNCVQCKHDIESEECDDVYDAKTGVLIPLHKGGCDYECDTCLGTNLITISSPDGSETYMGPGKCPDCIDGRHNNP